MTGTSRRLIWFCAVAWAGAMLGGCGGEGAGRSESKGLVREIDLGPQIGDLVEVADPAPAVVQGYGIVGGLRGTGSAECPPAVRDYLRRYMIAQLGGERVDADGFIDDPGTAVVLLQGQIPAAASQGERFDVRVVALPGSQTTSLEGGWLYSAELMPGGTLGYSAQPAAKVEGAVYIDALATVAQDMRSGYVLGGGRALRGYQGRMTILKPDFRVAAAIRDKLNGRFGAGVANAVSSSEIVLEVPAAYRDRKLRFIEIVKAMYVTDPLGFVEERVRTHVRELAVLDDKYASEVALEAIGRMSLEKLGVLLRSGDEEVRFRAARSITNVGSERGLAALRAIAEDRSSQWRIESVRAIGETAPPGTASQICRGLLGDRDLPVVLTAYEQLRRSGDSIVEQEFIGRSFRLERVRRPDLRVIYASRTGVPRIILLGAQLQFRAGTLFQSEDGNIVIDSRGATGQVGISRKHPTRPVMIGPFRSGDDLGDIIRILCEEPTRVAQGHQRGLGVPYAQVIAALKQFCEKRFVEAEFWAGPLPKTGLIVKKPPGSGR